MTTDVITENTTAQNVATPDNTYTGFTFNNMKNGTGSVPTTNFNTEATAEISEYQSTYQERWLLKFSGLSNITGPVTVTSATIYIYVTGQSGTDNLTVDAHAIRRDWNETQSNWTNYSTGNAWSTAGAGNTSSDRFTPADGTGTTGTGSPSYWFSITGANLAQRVEDYINGNETNYGWIIQVQDATPGTEYKSAQTPRSNYNGQKPELVVTYTAGSSSSGLLLQSNNSAGL